MKRQQDDVGVRARGEGLDWKEEGAWAKKLVQAARRAVEDKRGRIYQKVMAQHEWYWRELYRASLCGTSGS